MNIEKKEGKEKLKSVWIGLVTVTPKRGNKFFEEETKGAFVNILAWADSKSTFKSEVKHALDDYHLNFVEMEDVEQLSIRLEKHNVDSRLTDLSVEVESTGKVRFGTFHYYENDDKT